jgi:hypothetical protein
MNMKETRLCSKCILPETAPNIQFDEHGVCNYCRNSKVFQPIGLEKLKSVIHSKLPGNKSKYDCFVPLSGGLDSSYVLFYAVRHLGLKCLALHLNIFTSEIATENAKRCCEKLGVKLRVENVDSKIITNLVVKSLEVGCSLGPAQCNYWMCHPCGYFLRTSIFNMALQERIPLYISGQHPSEFMLWRYSRDSPLFTKIFNKNVGRYILMKFYELIFRMCYKNQCGIFNFTNSIVNVGIKNYGYPILKKADSTEIKLFDYIPYNMGYMRATLQSELGWREEEGAFGSKHFDCRIFPLKDFLFKCTFGFPLHVAALSNHIRYGYIYRDDALQVMDQYWASINKIEAEVEDVLTEVLKLPPRKVKEFMNMRGWSNKKSYRSPNKIIYRKDFVKGW